MISGYARTYVDFWTGSTGIKMAALNDDGVRALAHYLFSGPNCTAFGLFFKPVETIVLEFKRPAKGQHAHAEQQVRKWLKVLGELEFAFHDEATGFVWVKEMAARQFHPLPLKPTNLLIKTARRWYQHLSRNPFLGDFFDRYDLDLHLSNPFAFPGSQVERREWVTRSEPEQTHLVDLERRNGKPLPVACGEQEFDEWWKAYPQHRRVERKAALDVWKRKRISIAEFPALMDALEKHKASSDWRKDGGKFVPRPAKYLRNERWDDEHGEMRSGLNDTNQATVDTMVELFREDKSDW